MMQKIWKLRNKKGFTLVELMVVVAIIGILVAIAVPVYNNITTKAQETTCLANMRTLTSAEIQFYADKGKYTANLDDLIPAYVKEAKCPAEGGTYTLNATDGSVTCSIHPITKP